jgi:hypothetical protein
LIAGIVLLASSSRAVTPETGADEGRSQGPNLGPSRPGVPLPPREPYAPGEPQPADDGAELEPDQQPTREPQAPIDSDTKRTTPDYDRRDEPTTPGDVLVWIPRIALAPLYLVSEFVVRRPLGWVVTTAEREHWPSLLIDFFTFGKERQAGIIPTGLIDFGLRPSVGLYFFWNEALAEQNQIRMRVASGGPDWWKLRLSDRYWLDDLQNVYVRGELSMRPDHLFHGFGPESDPTRIRFRMNRYDADIGYGADLWRSSDIALFAGFRGVSFDPETSCCGDPSIAEAIAEGRFPAPPGLEDGYRLIHYGGSARLDTRAERLLMAPEPGIDYLPAPGTGVGLELRAEHAIGVDAEPVHFVRYGATLGLFADPTELQRVLGLELIVDFAEPLNDEPIPFTEQVTLGGDRPLRGFREGRLVDRSAAVARVTYTWPVWVFLDGVLHYAVGNVFGPQLEGFDPELFRSSFGVGLRASDKRDDAFELLVAWGTETFRDGANPDEFRFVLGATGGF